MALTVVAATDVTFTPDSLGKTEIDLGVDFDQAVASVNVPDRHCMLASVQITAPHKVTVRVENTDGTPYANQCTVSVIAVKH